jgi:hypothetical protein
MDIIFNKHLQLNEPGLKINYFPCEAQFILKLTKNMKVILKIGRALRQAVSNCKVALLVILDSIQKFSPPFVIRWVCVKSVKSRPCPAHTPSAATHCSHLSLRSRLLPTHYFPLILQQAAEAAFLKFSSAFFAAS